MEKSCLVYAHLKSFIWPSIWQWHKIPWKILQVKLPWATYWAHLFDTSCQSFGPEVSGVHLRSGQICEHQAWLRRHGPDQEEKVPGRRGVYRRSLQHPPKTDLHRDRYQREERGCQTPPVLASSCSIKVWTLTQSFLGRPRKSKSVASSQIFVVYLLKLEDWSIRWFNIRDDSEKCWTWEKCYLLTYLH